MARFTIRNGREFFISLLLLILALQGCQNYDPSIPDRPVFLKRNIYTYKISGFGQYLYVDSRKLEADRIGYGGILIVHTFSIDDANGYFAFDLSCPVEHSENIKIGNPNLSLICTCASCGEKYDLSQGLGTPLNHFSKEPLRKYSVRIDNGNLLITP